MGRKWIIDVLADLRAFAETNDLPLLAAELKQAAVVAEGELGSVAGGRLRTVEGNGTRILSGAGRTGAGA